MIIDFLHEFLKGFFARIYTWSVWGGHLGMIMIDERSFHLFLLPGLHCLTFGTLLGIYWWARKE